MHTYPGVSFCIERKLLILTPFQQKQHSSLYWQGLFNGSHVNACTLADIDAVKAATIARK
jgi:hypothetical protein